MALLAPSFPGAPMTRAYQVSVFHFLGTVPFSSGSHVCAFVSIWEREVGSHRATWLEARMSGAGDGRGDARATGPPATSPAGANCTLTFPQQLCFHAAILLRLPLRRNCLLKKKQPSAWVHLQADYAIPRQDFLRWTSCLDPGNRQPDNQRARVGGVQAGR